MWKNFFKIIFIVFFSPIYGQIGSWNILNVKYENIDWILVGEAQLRSLLFYNHFHYYEYKVFINKKWSESLITSLGIGNYQTFQEGGNFVVPKNSSEIRLGPQVITLQRLKPLQLENRYRIELRFTNNGYRNRFRYRVNVKYEIKKIHLSIFINNELFFSNNAPYFERNRFSLILQYKIYKNINYQLGFLNQWDNKVNDEIGRNFLVLGIMVDLKNFFQSTEQILD